MKRAISCALIILVAAVAGSALAQVNTTNTTDTGMGTSINASGTVVSSSGSQLVIKTESGNRMTFVVDSASSLPVGVAAGDRVTVEYHTLAGGKYHAARVSTVSVDMPPSTDSDRYDTGTTTGTGTVNPDPSRTYNDNDRVDDTLPRTASPLPLIALIGALSAGAAVGLRLFARS